MGKLNIFAKLCQSCGAIDSKKDGVELLMPICSRHGGISEKKGVVMKDQESRIVLQENIEGHKDKLILLRLKKKLTLKGKS